MSHIETTQLSCGTSRNRTNCCEAVSCKAAGAWIGDITTASAWADSECHSDAQSDCCSKIGQSGEPAVSCRQHIETYANPGCQINTSGCGGAGLDPCIRYGCYCQ